MKYYILVTVVHLFLSTVLSAQERFTPYKLNINLLSESDRVYLNGYPTSTPLGEAVSLRENFQFTEISTNKPFFGWAAPSLTDNTKQAAYRLLVASESEFLEKDTADMWDSGKIESENSINIHYEGKQLESDKVYSWKVKIWDNKGNESNYSNISQFKTSDSLQNYFTDRHPIQKKDEFPDHIEQFDKNSYFADFGKAAFGRLRLNLFSENGSDTVKIHLGEVQNNNRIERSPGGSRRYAEYHIVPIKGWNTYIITIRQDQRNTGNQAILIPEYIGEVTPFRYCEIENYKHPLKERDLIILLMNLIPIFQVPIPYLIRFGSFQNIPLRRPLSLVFMLTVIVNEFRTKLMQLSISSPITVFPVTDTTWQDILMTSLSIIQHGLQNGLCSQFL
jgi:hypothetical protein